MLEHSRNLLEPIVRGQDPQHLFPSFVFRLLQSPGPAGATPAQQLHARFEQLLDDESALNALSRDLELFQRYLQRARSDEP